jgi:hypothetical protein
MTTNLQEKQSCGITYSSNSNVDLTSHTAPNINLKQLFGLSNIVILLEQVKGQVVQVCFDWLAPKMQALRSSETSANMY